ncbi:MAG: trypsin-like peptidase domain-containing protein [Oscillibacter sp.]|nr:trypsin-like peptidase domain-containing protein [Oscillibacter sp.]
MKHRIFAILCTLALLIGTIPAASALEGEITLAADTLATLGLVQGNSQGDYQPNLPATRTQAAVLLVRLAGAEAAAKAEPWFSGFRDVPAWASDSVDYAVHQGWMSGATPVTFRGQDAIDACEWFSALLRMLGYGDEDFTLDDAPVFAHRIGLTPLLYDGALKRSDLFLSMRDALSFPHKDSDVTVLEQLIQTGSTSRAAANALGLLTPELTARQVADRHMAAVFQLECYESNSSVAHQNPDAGASGFFITSDGLAITNYHSIEGAVHARAILTSGDTYPVESVLYYDEGIDIAVIRISRTSTSGRRTSSFAWLEMAPSGSGDVRRGDTVYAIGNPLALGLSVSSGVVGDPARVVAGYDTPCILNNADISHGSSGGALLNVYGQVIGITSGAYTSGNSMYLAVPIDSALTADLSGAGQTLEQVKQETHS